MSISHHAFVAAVAAAIRAPSLHNSQPWRFRRCRDEIHVLADPNRTPPVTDAESWATHIACGAATYNLQLAFAVAEQPMAVRWRPDANEPRLMAVLRPIDPRPPTPHQVRLYQAIPRRHSNRRPFLPRPVPVEVRRALVTAAVEEGVWIDLIVGAIGAAAVSEITHAASRVLHRNQAYATDPAPPNRRARTGATGIPEADRPDPAAESSDLDAESYDLLPQCPLSDLVRGAAPNLTDDPLIAVLGTAGDTPRDQLHAGFALQRVLLTITDHGLASSLLSQPIEVPSAREQLRIALGRYGTPQMVLRVGYAEPASPTPRRPVAEVIEASVDGPTDPATRALRP